MAAKGKLSFGFDGDEDAESATSAAPTPRGSTPVDSSAVNSETEGKVPKKKLGANTKIGFQPRVMTKSALAREAQQAELARKDFVAMRDAVKATEIVIPFVFYDGTNIPGGRCRVKKGDHIWLFLDKARKVGAELGVGGDKSRRDWARVSVDDLMLVRGEVILPHVRIFHQDIFMAKLTDCSTMSSTTSYSTRSMGSMVQFLTILQRQPKLPRWQPRQTLRHRPTTILSSVLKKKKIKSHRFQTKSLRVSKMMPLSQRWLTADGMSATSTSSPRASGKSTIQRKTSRKLSGRMPKAIHSSSHKVCQHLQKTNLDQVITGELAPQGVSFPTLGARGSHSCSFYSISSYTLYRTS